MLAVRNNQNDSGKVVQVHVGDTKLISRSAKVTMTQ